MHTEDETQGATSKRSPGLRQLRHTAPGVFVTSLLPEKSRYSSDNVSVGSSDSVASVLTSMLASKPALATLIRTVKHCVFSQDGDGSVAVLNLQDKSVLFHFGQQMPWVGSQSTHHL
jgi:hypothetical protein